MNYDNLKQILFEITDIVHKERRILGAFILGFLALKVGAYWYEETSSAAVLKIIAKSSPLDSFSDISNHRYTTVYNSSHSSEATHPIHLFRFDPNTASYQDLTTLGLSPKTANILINWREKGKVFYKKEDLAKVYGLSPEIYKKLEPYIDIPTNSFSSHHPSKTTFESKSPKILDINLASVEDFESLRGIGSGFANSFVKYRTALGGFYSVEQLKEVYHLSDTTYEQIKPYLMLKNTSVQKININTATYEVLNAHPYISSKQATEILKERPIYGIDDLYELFFFKDRDKVKKMIPYLEF